MKTPLAGLLLTLVTVAVVAEEKAPVPPRVRVVMTGKGEAFFQSSNVRIEVKPGEDLRKKIEEALKEVTATAFKVGEGEGVVVVFPANAVKVEDALKVIGGLAVVEGVLGFSDDAILIASAGAKGAKRVPVLVALKVGKLDDKAKGDYPAVNHAVVEGQAVRGEFKIGTETFEWSMQDGDGRIPLRLPKGVKSPEPGTQIRASGKVRVAEGQWVLEVAKVEPMKK
jgi:hypothetical protein